jgi:hypothetical protein
VPGLGYQSGRGHRLAHRPAHEHGGQDSPDSRAWVARGSHGHRSCYLRRASRSASSSQRLTARIASSFAGIPCGNSDLSSPSRFTPSAVAAVLLARGATAAGALTVEAAVRVFAGFPRFVPPLAACVDEPATPCTRRCAPSAAARANVRPHSGQTNLLERAAREVTVGVARLRVVFGVARRVDLFAVALFEAARFPVAVLVLALGMSSPLLKSDQLQSGKHTARRRRPRCVCFSI